MRRITPRRGLQKRINVASHTHHTEIPGSCGTLVDFQNTSLHATERAGIHELAFLDKCFPPLVRTLGCIARFSAPPPSHRTPYSFPRAISLLQKKLCRDPPVPVCYIFLRSRRYSNSSTFFSSPSTVEQETPTVASSLPYLTNIISVVNALW